LIPTANPPPWSPGGKMTAPGSTPGAVNRGSDLDARLYAIIAPPRQCSAATRNMPKRYWLRRDAAAARRPGLGADRFSLPF